MTCSTYPKREVAKTIKFFGTTEPGLIHEWLTLSTSHSSFILGTVLSLFFFSSFWELHFPLTPSIWFPLELPSSAISLTLQLELAGWAVHTSLKLNQNSLHWDFSSGTESQLRVTVTKKLFRSLISLQYFLCSLTASHNLQTSHIVPSSSVHRIIQARILEWIAVPFSRESSQPRDGSQVSCIAGRFFTSWGTGEAPLCSCLLAFPFISSSNNVLPLDICRTDIHLSFMCQL